MLISYSHRFIYFHVAKTGGLSIREALKGYAGEPERFGRLRRPPRLVEGEPNPLYAMWESLLLHARAAEARRGLSAELFDASYKFAFVRNPWDWQVSMYHFILKEIGHIHHRTVSAMAGFEEYLAWVVRTDKPFARGATKLQTEMLTDESGRLLVDFVGRYETLERDFAAVCDRLGIHAPLPTLNQSPRERDYRPHYTSRARRLVREHFRADIDRFGYEFDGVAADLPPPGPVTHGLTAQIRQRMAP
ncbi:MAG: sulfotransferase family 2 domain-containing protein [Methylococcus sp.]